MEPDPYDTDAYPMGPPMTQRPASPAAPPLPKPKRPPKPDPAARRMKPLDYVALLLGVEPPPPDADLPPPVGYRFPDPLPPEPALPPPVAAVPPPFPPVGPGDQPGYGVPYQMHRRRMSDKLGF